MDIKTLICSICGFKMITVWDEKISKFEDIQTNCFNCCNSFLLKPDTEKNELVIKQILEIPFHVVDYASDEETGQKWVCGDHYEDKKKRNKKQFEIDSYYDHLLRQVIEVLPDIDPDIPLCYFEWAFEIPKAYWLYENGDRVKWRTERNEEILITSYPKHEELKRIDNFPDALKLAFEGHLITREKYIRDRDVHFWFMNESGFWTFASGVTSANIYHFELDNEDIMSNEWILCDHLKPILENHLTNEGKKTKMKIPELKKEEKEFKERVALETLNPCPDCGKPDPHCIYTDLAYDTNIETCIHCGTQYVLKYEVIENEKEEPTFNFDIFEICKEPVTGIQKSFSISTDFDEDD